MVIGTMAFDGWTVTFDAVKWHFVGTQPNPIITVLNVTIYPLVHCTNSMLSII